MKYKHIISIFLAGVIMQVLASLQKIMHAPGADLLFKISAGIMVIALLLAIIKMLLTKNKNSILNK